MHPTASFYFLAGQSIGYLGAHWRATLIINAVFFVFLVIFDFNSATRPLCLFLGWLSAFWLPEFCMNTQAEFFLLAVKHQNKLLVYVIEVFLFLLVTSVVSIDDHEIWPWFVVLALHLGYSLFLYHASFLLQKVVTPKEHNMYKFYMVLLPVTDVVLLLVALVHAHHTMHFVSLLIATPVVAVVLYFVFHVFSGQERRHLTQEIVVSV